MIDFVKNVGILAMLGAAVWTLYQWRHNWPERRRIYALWGGFAVGALLGSRLGVASAGNAVNGAYVFAPIFGWIAFLLEPSLKRPTPGQPATSSEATDISRS